MNRVLAVFAVIAMALTLSIATAEPKGEGNAKAGQRAERAQKERAPQVRLRAPFNKLEDLSEDQKAKIGAIQRETMEKMKQLRQEEQEKITAVLTPGQKAQIEAAQKAQADEAAAKRKERAGAEGKKAEKPKRERPNNKKKGGEEGAGEDEL